MIKQSTKTRKSSKAKSVTIIARYFIKRNGHVVYRVRSSNGVDTYCTTIINGQATGCTCPAVKPCYHMTQLEKIECERAERIAAQSEQANEKKLAERKLEESYRELAQAQLEWAEHWAPLLGITVDALLAMGIGEYRPLIEAYEDGRNRYNNMALALGW